MSEIVITLPANSTVTIKTKVQNAEPSDQVQGNTTPGVCSRVIVAEGDVEEPLKKSLPEDGEWLFVSSGDEKDDAKAPRSKKRTKAVSQIILYELNKTSSNNYKGKFHADRHCFCVDKKRVIHRGFSGYKAIPKDRLCTQSKCLVAFADMIQSDDHMKRSQP